MLTRLYFRFACLLLGLAVSGLRAQETPPPAGPDNATLAAAAVASGKVAVARTPDFLEHLVDSILKAFNIRTSGNTLTHYTISIFLLVVALLARRLITNVVFAVLRKLAAKTETTLDDKLFPALEAPAATFVMVVGVFSSLTVGGGRHAVRHGRARPSSNDGGRAHADRRAAAAEASGARREAGDGWWQHGACVREM